MEGGSCNDYDYVCGDPVNGFDLTGMKPQPALPAELEERCNPLRNSNYGDLAREPVLHAGRLKSAVSTWRTFTTGVIAVSRAL